VPDPCATVLSKNGEELFRHIFARSSPCSWLESCGWFLWSTTCHRKMPDHRARHFAFPRMLCLSCTSLSSQDQAWLPYSLCTVRLGCLYVWTMCVSRRILPVHSRCIHLHQHRAFLQNFCRFLSFLLLFCLCRPPRTLCETFREQRGGASHGGTLRRMVGSKKERCFPYTRSGTAVPDRDSVAVLHVQDDSRHDRAQGAHLYGWTQKRAEKRFYAHARAHSVPCPCTPCEISALLFASRQCNARGSYVMHGRGSGHSTADGAVVTRAEIRWQAEALVVRTRQRSPQKIRSSPWGKILKLFRNQTTGTGAKNA